MRLVNLSVSFIVVTLALSLILSLGLFSSNVQALSDAQVEGYLSAHRSPLPSWTIGAFSRAHPDFDVAGYLAVVYCESSLGKDCGHATNNVGCIKGGKVGTVWRDLRVGTWRGFNLYASIYDGNRAAIRLIYDRGYNTMLASHSFEAFSRKYYGNVAGRVSYMNRLIKAHNRIEAELN